MKKRSIFIAAAMSLFMVTTPALASVPGVDSSMEGAKKGIVAVSHPLAAEAGIKVLEQSGNAVDAAAAIQLSLNVVEPMMSGIGGGGFMMIYLKEQNTMTVIDSREMAPQQVTPLLFLDDMGQPLPWFERHTSGKAVGVPGTLKGVETALEQYGTMSLSEVIDPAITYAEQGIQVNWSMAQYIQENIEKLQQYGTAGEVFVPNGQPLQEGDLLLQPDLAKTLKLIKADGAAALYDGEIGEAMVNEVQKRGGSMTVEDLQNYAVKEREPVMGEYRGYEIASMSPPSSGGLTVIHILKLMEGYDVNKMGINSAEYLHRFIEAMHLAYADRAAYMADEDFYPVPKQGLLHDDYISERRELIHPNQAAAVVSEGDPWQYDDTNGVDMPSVMEETPTGQTTHFSVMDQWGNMVSYTTTIEQVFGSGIMVPGYGFMLNNEMTDFDAVPGGVNQVEPGKRPRSSMSPTLVIKDGQPFMAVGSPGGPTIIASVAQTIMNVIDHQLPIQQAILKPRIYSSNYPTVRWEAGIEQDVILKLLAMGHQFEEAPQDIGNVQAVIYDDETGTMYGGADNTREGTVLGVDAGSFIVEQPMDEQPLLEKAPFKLKVNGTSYPFLASQLLMRDGTSYVLADKLMLGLGLHADLVQPEVQTIDGQSYLPVRTVAEAQGYKVFWDREKHEVLLMKEQTQVITDVQKHYSEDHFKITN